MSVAELKDLIISKVREIEDEGLLEQCWTIINPENADHPELNESELKDLEERDQEVENGNYYSHQEFISLVKDRLDRYKKNG